MLEEATLEMTTGAFQRENDADKRLLVMFHEHAVQNKAKSALEGRPIFEPQTYVTIMVPGDKDSIVDRRAEQRDFDRFPKQHSAYLNKQSQETAAGTPLKAVSFLTSSQVKELEYFHVYTVEQLSAIPDAHALRFMALQRLKQQASDFLQAAKEVAPMTAMRAEMEQKDTQLSAMQKAIDEQANAIRGLQAALAAKANEEA